MFVFYRWLDICFQNLLPHSSPTCETQLQSLMDPLPCFTVEQVFFPPNTAARVLPDLHLSTRPVLKMHQAYQDAMKFASSPQKVSLNTTITAKSAISSWGFFVKQDSDFYVELHSFLNHILTWRPGDPQTWLSCHSLLLLSGLTHSCWLLVTWVWVFINL